MPRPMPPFPPVTSATFPVRSNGLNAMAEFSLFRFLSGLDQVAVQAPSTLSAAPVAAEPMSETR